jgi:putative PIG3 family NAD(P)H quinone oxidoreductase
MRAIVIREPGGPEVLEIRDVPRPEPSRGEVRVKVGATAVNRADLLQRMGTYPAPPGSPSDIPGLEVAGEVDSVGADVTELSHGDRVMGLVGGGGYAEFVVAHARTLSRMPAGMSFADAAAIPEAFLTAWDAIVAQARLSSGETVLVHAAGSGVGTAGVQIARAIGARPIGTLRTPQKLGRARELGLVDGIVVEGAKFADEVLARTAGRGVDVVLELVGGAYVAQDLLCLAHRGRIVVVGTMGGGRVDLDLSLLMRKRAELRGTMLRSRPLEEKIVAGQALQRHLVPLFESGALRPVVDRVLPLSRAADAHRLMQNNDAFGKLVLEV